jgi:hypothetical protein
MNTLCSCFARFLGAVALVAVFLNTTAVASAPAGQYTLTSATVFDTKTKLTWERVALGTPMTWADAKTYCGSASTSARLGGSGWRLPTIKELYTILDHSQNPAIDTNAFPSTPAGGFWSSTTFTANPPDMWYADFSSGDLVFSAPTNALFVRCVR